MKFKLSKKTIQAIELKIVSQLNDDATIVEYESEPLEEKGEILYYGYSLDLSTTIDSTIEISGEQLDVDHFAQDQNYTVSCNVTGYTKESESAVIAVNKQTGEIIINAIKPAPFSDISSFEINDAGSLEDASLYIDELKDQDNWDNDYKNDLALKQTSLIVDPSTLFDD